MSVLPIVTYDDDVLRKKAKPVNENSEEIQTFIEDLFETMYNSNGIGLAAPQVGTSLRIFVIDADGVMDEEEELYGKMAFINPKIIEASDDQVSMDEGCLSIPEITDKVKRPSRIKVQFLDQNFNEKELDVDGWMSRVIQHEYDHLDGVLFIDYLSIFRKRMHKSDLEEIAAGERETKYPLVPK